MEEKLERKQIIMEFDTFEDAERAIQKLMLETNVVVKNGDKVYWFQNITTPHIIVTFEADAKELDVEVASSEQKTKIST